ncbi:hypothetical protein ACP70R_000153 [Stipagrostis hirtigluma subsp. patula]
MTRRRGRPGRTTEHRPDGAGLTTLALRLAKHLAGAAGGGANLVFSPLSVYAALALVAAGARGDTLRELLDALGARSLGDLAAFVRRVAERALADRSRSGGPAVSFACGVWHDASSTLQPGFWETAAESYKAQARAVDFQHKPREAIGEIKRWVAAATNKLIDSIVDPSAVRWDTSLVLANAIYFKGKWETPFAEAATTVDKFHRLDGSTADARFMRSGQSQFISVRDGYKVLKLPYQSPVPPQLGRSSRSRMGADLPQYSMCVFLPDSRDGLPDLVDTIASSAGFRRDNLPNKRVPVGQLRLPKFKLSFYRSIRDVLIEDMGIKAAFDTDADLSDMAKCNDPEGMPLFVGHVRHKAVLEVNEEGTEAAAATVCTMRCMAAPRPRSPPRTVDFIADHPFAFFVIEEVSGAIVFVGHVLDPLSSR